MAEKFEIQIEAELFIHNDLSNCAWGLRNVMREKIESDETEEVNCEIMGSLGS